MKTLYYPGSFDPIGNHHLILAQFAMEQGGYDRVAFIPCCSAPHKTGQTPFAQRMDMICHAIARSDFVVDDVEQTMFEENGKKNYTIDTARRLHARDGEKPHLLIGGDCLAILHKWYQSGDLLKEAHFVVYPRVGHPIPVTTYEWLDRAGVEPTFLKEMVEVNVSSTLIRQRVKEGRKIDYLVPSTVATYIRSTGLYR